MTGPTSQQAPTVGARLGDWILEEPLGSGGIAAVFRATNVEDGRAAAVKVLHPASVGTDEVRRFHREYKALARLSHPGIVSVYETGIADDYPWIAMELVEGRDLSATLKTWKEADPPDRWARVERIVRGLCEALAYIHDLGLVHRDLKPSNVLLDAEGSPKLGDFGVVKDRHAHTTALTRHGDLVGTVAFMAPEQILDEPVDARTDLYSLGAMLYVMLTDRRPIEADSVTGFLARHIAHVPPAPSAVRPDVPRLLESVCQRLLYKDRTHRFASADAVLRALDQADGPPRPPLRGRDSLVAAWHDRVAALRDGEAGVIALTGPWGSGTTFALDALLDAVDVPVLRASATDRNPITSLLRAAGAPTDGPTSGHLRALAEHLRTEPHVLALDDADRADPRIIQAVARLVRKLIVQEKRPLLVIYTAHDPVSEGLAPLHRGTVSEVRARSWRLGRLTRRATLQLVRDRGLKGGVASVLGRRLHEELLGRPAAAHLQLGALAAEGWLERIDGSFQPARTPKECARPPLPVPAEARVRLERLLKHLDPDALAAAEVTALVDRPIEVARVLAIAEAASTVEDPLIACGLWRHTREDDVERVTLDAPWAATVLVDDMGETRKRSVHRAIARVLGASRRRSLAAEVARHHQAAGDLELAWPLYLQAARVAAQERNHPRVLSLSRRARAIEEAGLEGVDDASRPVLLGRARQLEGEAWLARGSWREAVRPLEDAARMARQSKDKAALARALAAQGRAWYRMGRFDEAEPRLEAALRYARPSDPERATALRGLADLRLRKNRLADSEALWSEAIGMARASGSEDAEARAVRGLAHLRVLEGRLHAASELLASAEDLMSSSAEPRVQTAILARALELDLAAGRFDAALARSEALLGLVERRDVEDRILEALGLRITACLALGKTKEATDLLLQLEPRLHGAPTSIRLRTARQRARLGPEAAALRHLPVQRDLPNDTIEDPAAQASAIRALALAPTRPNESLDLARWCLARPRARLVLRHVDIHLDAGEALLAAGDRRGAREAAKAGLRHVSGAGGDGMRLELLSLFHRADDDPRILQALQQVARRIRKGQPPEIAKALGERPDLAPALEG